MSKNPVRMAIVGGRRGSAFQKTLEALSDKLELVAFCDLKEEVNASMKERFPHIKLFTRFEDVLDDPDVDAVYLATPQSLHAAQSIAALEAGKHVLSEVIATNNMEENWALVEAVEKSGLTYMMAENYIFTRSNMMIWNMSELGVFGEKTFAEGGYIHDTKHLHLNPDGSLTWRGEGSRGSNSYSYPTHSVGPIAKWLKINRDGGDEFESLATFTSRELASRTYCLERFGEEHEGAKEGFWKRSDCLITMVKTKKGTLIELRSDSKSFRPQQSYHYSLQGINGVFMSGRFRGEDPIVWLRGRSPGTSPHQPNEPKAAWEKLWNYVEEYDHPLWRQYREVAEKTGHEGGDFFVMNEFSSAILENRQPIVDVYDAVTWSSIRPLSIQSIENQNKVVPFVRFHKAPYA
jgi:hypothetical protein